MKRRERNVLLRLMEDYPRGVRIDRIPDGNGRFHRDSSPALCLTIGLLVEDGLVAKARDSEGWEGYALTEHGLVLARQMAAS